MRERLFSIVSYAICDQRSLRSHAFCSGATLVAKIYKIFCGNTSPIQLTIR